MRYLFITVIALMVCMTASGKDFKGDVSVGRELDANRAVISGTAGDGAIEMYHQSGAPSAPSGANDLKIFVDTKQIKTIDTDSNIATLGEGGVGGAGNKVNVIENPDFEVPRNTNNWTASGSSVKSVETTSELFGDQSLKWNPSAASEYLTSDAVAIPKGLYGKDCEISFYYSWDGATAGHMSAYAYDGSNALHEVLELVPTSSGESLKARVAFTCPTSGNLQLRLESLNSSAADIIVDNMWAGSDLNSFELSETELYGSKKWVATTDCQWSKAANNWNDFSADADCDDNPRVFVGKAIADASNDGQIPRIRVSNLEPGNYRVTFRAQFTHEGAGTSSVDWGITDGTTRKDVTRITTLANQQRPQINIIETEFQYTSGKGTTTFTLLANRADGASTAYVYVRWDEMLVSVYRYPLDSQKAVSVDTSALAWSGYHDDTCIWSRTNTAYGDFTADATCNLVETINYNFGTVTGYGSELPGIVWTPRRTGVYNVCAVLVGSGGTADASQAYELSDLTPTVIAESGHRQESDNTNRRDSVTLCGLYEVSNFNQKTIRIRGKADNGAVQIRQGVGSAPVNPIYWSIYPVTQNLPQAYVYGDKVSEIALDNEFTGGSIRIVKVERMVTISSISSLTHAADSFVESSAGLIPDWGRPDVDAYNSYALSTAIQTRATVYTDGTIAITHYDHAGNLSNQTSGGGLTISYTVSD